MDEFDILIDNANKRLRYLKDYRSIAKAIKDRACSYFNDSRVIVFGSVVKGKVTASSDIDILIIVNKRDYNRELRFRASIIKDMFDIPIELHFASKDEFKGWYARFIDKYEEID